MRISGCLSTQAGDRAGDLFLQTNNYLNCSYYSARSGIEAVTFQLAEAFM